MSEEESKLDRRKFLSKSFKGVVGASIAILATKVPAYRAELGEDSTSVTALTGGGTNVVPPHSSHSSHSSRGWR